MEIVVLSSFQKKALARFLKSQLSKKFYLAGGTALAEFYLKHRKSEDLDFFTQDELDFKEIKKFSETLQKIVPLQKIEFLKRFGLLTFFFYPINEVAKYKIDFGQYPFETIEPLKKFGNLQVESLYDIAVDKAHTISVNPRFRDFVDMFFILKKEKEWKFQDLFKRAQEKFELAVNPIQLGQSLLQVKTLTDMPIMLKNLNLKEMQKFFLNEALTLKKEILA